MTCASIHLTTWRNGMKKKLVYSLLLSIKGLSRIFYRHDISWIGDVPQNPWQDLRLVAFLNHTSLYEPLFVGWFPSHFLKRIAYHGLMPIAKKALQRPVMGHFFKLVVGDVVSVTRKKDHTWEEMFQRLKSDAMVIIMPEGRMKRINGLDKHGKAMTMRGGIADLLKAIPSGRMLLTYSGGMHHIQAPGQPVPRIFKTLRMHLENIDIARYREGILKKSGEANFKECVISDLETRRDQYCPIQN